MVNHHEHVYWGTLEADECDLCATDGLIILWVPSEAPTTNFGDDSTEEFGDKEYWRDKRAIK
jgi:hypothetical protein